MIWLILGLLLWIVPHEWKRLSPDSRAARGDAGKGIVALGVLVGLVLIVIGYRSWDDAPYLYASPAWTWHVNNLLMFLAFYLYAASGMKTRAARVIRHPQLTAIILWALAHLLVNGDMASVILFGTLLTWAVVEIGLINRATPTWTPPPPAPVGKEIGAFVGAILVMGVVGWIHGWIGPWPFGGAM